MTSKAATPPPLDIASSSSSSITNFNNVVLQPTSQTVAARTEYQPQLQANAASKTIATRNTTATTNTAAVSTATGTAASSATGTAAASSATGIAAASSATGTAAGCTSTGAHNTKQVLNLDPTPSNVPPNSTTGTGTYQGQFKLLVESSTGTATVQREESITFVKKAVDAELGTTGTSEDEGMSVPVYKLSNGRLPTNVSPTHWAMQSDREYLKNLHVRGTLPYGVDTTGRGSIALFVRDANISRGVRLFLETPVVDFLDEITLENCACVCKLWWSELHSLTRIRKRVPLRSSMSRHNRSNLWMLLLAGDYAFCSVDKYMDLLLTESNFDAPILRDVGRTFPNLRHFMNPNSFGQRSLFRLMHSAAVQVPSVGYCQGLNFLAGVLLVVLPNELAAFQCLLGLLCSHDLRSLFRPDFALLKRLLYQLDSMIQLFMPNLAQHLEQHGLSSSFFATSWFLTLFSYEVPMSIAIHFMDQFILRGWQVVFQLALAFLFCSQKYMRNLSFEHTLLFVKNFPRQFCLFEMRIEQLLSLASAHVLGESLDLVPTGSRTPATTGTSEKTPVARLLRAVRLMSEEQRDELLMSPQNDAGLETHFSRGFLEAASQDNNHTANHNATAGDSVVADAGNNYKSTTSVLSNANSSTTRCDGVIGNRQSLASSTAASISAESYQDSRSTVNLSVAATSDSATESPTGSSHRSDAIDSTQSQVELAATSARRVAHMILTSAAQFKVTQSMLKEFEIHYERGGVDTVPVQGPQDNSPTAVVIGGGEYFHSPIREDKCQTDERRLRSALSSSFLRRCVPQLRGSPRPISVERTSATTAVATTKVAHRGGSRHASVAHQDSRGVATSPRVLRGKLNMASAVARKGDGVHSRRGMINSVKFKITQHILLSNDELVEKQSAGRQGRRLPLKKPVSNSSSGSTPVVAVSSSLNSSGEEEGGYPRGPSPHRAVEHHLAVDSSTMASTGSLPRRAGATSTPHRAGASSTPHRAGASSTPHRADESSKIECATSYDKNGVIVVDVSRSLNQQHKHVRQLASGANIVKRVEIVCPTPPTSRPTSGHTQAPTSGHTQAPTSGHTQAPTSGLFSESRRGSTPMETFTGEKPSVVRATTGGVLQSRQRGESQGRPPGSNKRRFPQLSTVKRQISRATGVGRRPTAACAAGATSTK